MFNTFNMGVGMTVVVAKRGGGRGPAPPFRPPERTPYVLGEIVDRRRGRHRYGIKTKIAVLVSGGGTNLQALLDAQQAGDLSAGEIVLVIASNPKAYALTRAAQAGVPAVVCSRKELAQPGRL